MTKTISAPTASHDAASLPIGTPGHEWLTYGDLRALSTSVTKAPHGLGIGRGDRVAIILPNRPEMAPPL